MLPLGLNLHFSRVHFATLVADAVQAAPKNRVYRARSPGRWVQPTGNFRDFFYKSLIFRRKTTVTRSGQFFPKSTHPEVMFLKFFHVNRISELGDQFTQSWWHPLILGGTLV